MQRARSGPGLCLLGAGGQGGFLGSRVKDGAGSYSVAPRVAPSPTEWTDVRGWPLLPATAQGRGVARTPLALGACNRREEV